jgi:hypothetical protein
LVVRSVAAGVNVEHGFVASAKIHLRAAGTATPRELTTVRSLPVVRSIGTHVNVGDWRWSVSYVP